MITLAAIVGISNGSFPPSDLPFLFIAVAIAGGAWLKLFSLRGQASLHPNNVIVGEARGVDLRQLPKGNKSKQRLSFLVERFDAAGNRQTPVPVEIEGKEINGLLHEGDQVRVRGRMRGSKPLRCKRVYNITTRTSVGAASRRYWGWFIAVVAFAVIFIPV
jgi:hypothetical protein